MMMVIGSCRKVTALYSKSLDGELSFKETLILRLHLSMCAFCKRYINQVQKIRVWIRQYFSLNESLKNGKAEQLPQAAKERIQEKIKEKLPTA